MLHINERAHTPATKKKGGQGDMVTGEGGRDEEGAVPLFAHHYIFLNLCF